jgi:hypothetical protein
MPNRDIHVPVGMTAGLVTALYFSKDQKGEDRIWEAIGGVLGGYGGGRFPDVFEAAKNNPYHRAFTHSLVAGTTVSITAKEATDAWVAFFREKADGCAERRKTANLTESDKLFVGIFEILLRVAAGIGPGFVAGYASHLALDACTRRSLPLA